MPAAGRGSRMGDAAPPKQYLQLAGRSVVEWSLAPLLARAECAGAVVTLSPGDDRWQHLEAAKDRRVRTAPGGAQRTDSVVAGLHALRGQAQDNDWVLVHDAARPCLSAAEVDALMTSLHADEVGGLLAAPVVDTLKRADADGRSLETVNREGLWRALTPQMFRYGILLRALVQAAERGLAVTDEAQAVELLGLRPRLVPGNADNIKITLPEDIMRAERILRARGQTAT
jgi:2-C-methyl-D-erythritol 4-phosphate cytidylyltransferase